MNIRSRLFWAVIFTFSAGVSSFAAPSTTGKEIPEALKPWMNWATWDDGAAECPTPYFEAGKHLCFWPSRVTLQADQTGGRFALGVTVFSQAWVPLPGGSDRWPTEVKANGTLVPVVEHDHRPAIQLAAGAWQVEGSFRWTEIPQAISIPPEIGILALTLNGKPVDAPAWDAEGMLWLKRAASSEPADKDFLAVKVYALVEDGIPLWLRTEVELVVSGKSREEDIGSILPEGWKLASVDSPIPVAVDDAGRIKAQVRAGKWKLKVSAFRLDNPKEFQYAPAAKPAIEEELVAFRAQPDFRMVDIVGAPSIDVSQTPFPEQWREFPVYRWDTATPFRIEERMRGMGLQKPAGLTISRALWLDESGRSFTFRDNIGGSMQQIWRLDAAAGQDLGSVRTADDGQGQLITRNPQNGLPGVEIRTRDLHLEATGRMERRKAISATGWQADADALKITLNLPPGWRLFALFGADWVRGDWLTAWTLLDLFLVLIFALAVFRLWGFGAAVLAFLAFGLSYHEPGAPRYLWLALLIPLALLRVVTSGWGYRLLAVWKWATVAVFVLVLVPFIVRQVQQTIYPQLEIVHSYSAWSGMLGDESPADYSPVRMSRADAPASNQNSMRDQAPSKDNMKYDTKARIQTGPGVPDWQWRTATFGWNGPVQATQQIRPILIPLPVERALSVLRIVLLLGLAGVILNAKRLGGSIFGGGSRVAMAGWMALIAVGLGAPCARAQVPDQETLAKLRERLLAPSDAYPTAADIPIVKLALNDRRLTMEAEIHTAIRTAVPLPGRLPSWAPLTVLVDSKPEAALRRDDGYLWVVLPAGVHQVRVEGLLADVTEWEWTFQLKPHRVEIEAPAWNFSGVKPDGLPEQQVFFALKQKAVAGQASYDRQDYQTVALVDRNLELGLVWQVHTTVSRLSDEGKAVALRIPLLPGENVLSSGVVVKDGFIEIRMGARETSFSWESELSVTDHIRLATKATDGWVERWHLVASPIWNVIVSGLPPVFESDNPELVPVWHPWPGESAELTLSRPQAVAGATTTVSKGTHTIDLGQRQRTSTLELSLRCSLGEDFLVGLPPEAEVTSLTHDGQVIPVRKDGTQLIIPMHPGEQSVTIGWKTNGPLGFLAKAGEVRLPVESANIETVIRPPAGRWILWTEGPLRGPAVRFWIVLVCSLLAAGILGRMSFSPLGSISWMLLMLGLTQVPLPAALIVIGWLFFLSWRGRESFLRLHPIGYNLLQVFLIGLTAITLGIFVTVVGAGLLGSPEMFITGNGSTRSVLKWYQAHCDASLPQPGCISVSLWWYRLLMLGWALWLAASLLRWLRWAWTQFSHGGCFRRGASKPSLPSAN